MPFATLFKDKSSSKNQDADNGMTRQRQTALAVIDAFNRIDTTTVWKLRDRSCWREIYPKSLGAMPQDNAACQQALNMLANTFKEMHMSVHEIIEDIPARKVCLWIIATGRTVSGPFTNEYVWSLEFDETGSQIIRWKEFADAISTKNLFPELMAAHTGNDTASQNDSSSIRSGGTSVGRNTASTNPIHDGLPTRADSMVSTASRASSNVSSPGLSHVSSSQHSQQPLYQPQAQHVMASSPLQQQHPSLDGPLPPTPPGQQQNSGSKPTTPRPNSQLPPTRSLRGVPTEIQGNGRTLGTLR
ncbi:Austinol synthesis protein H [Lasiodiplodia hormozganensis]|uniref:Austinol synthesis protein H n=1 Tax=Lasiodiplodia hormozganensis TaxID=869390 RepID=A0AA40CK56_9PEZI|nr:Austinol synthesis protein H [Lasiodiplodia hormozganensis]